MRDPARRTTASSTIENPYVRDLIDHCEFDTIYHEHLCYFSCTAVDAPDARATASYLNHVEHFPELHGGTLRWHVGPRDGAASSGATQYLAPRKRARGSTRFDYYAGVRRPRRARSGATCASCSQRSAADGKRIAAYGAAAKGARCSTTSASAPTSSTTSSTATCTSRACYMPGVHLPIRDRRGAARGRCPTTCCCSPGTSRTRSCASRQEYRDARRPVHRARARRRRSCEPAAAERREATLDDVPPARPAGQPA